MWRCQITLKTLNLRKTVPLHFSNSYTWTTFMHAMLPDPIITSSVSSKWVMTLMPRALLSNLRKISSTRFVSQFFFFRNNYGLFWRFRQILPNLLMTSCSFSNYFNHKWRKVATRNSWACSTLHHRLFQKRLLPSYIKSSKKVFKRCCQMFWWRHLSSRNFLTLPNMSTPSS